MANLELLEEFNITQRFSELAMYEGECFVKKVKLEAGLRVWMNWASKVGTRWSG